MIAPLAQHGEDCRARLALHKLECLRSQGLHVFVVDQTPFGSALAWSEQCSRENLPGRFGVLGPALETSNRELSEIARDVYHLVADGPRVAAIAKCAPLAAGGLLMPSMPSSLDARASAEKLRRLGEARKFGPVLVVCFMLNRYAVRAAIARPADGAPADYDPPVLASPVGQRIALAGAVHSGLIDELDGSAAARDHRARRRRRWTRGVTAGGRLRVSLEREFAPTADGAGAAP